MKILRWCAVRMSVTPLEMCLTYGLFSSGIIPVRYARYVSLGLVTFWSILSWLILYWIIIHHDQYRYFSFIHCDRASKALHEAGRASKPTPTTGYPISRVSIVRCKTCRNPDDIPDLPSTFRLTLPKTFSSPFQPSPRLSTPPSTTSHRRSNASRSNRSRDTNFFAAAVVFSPSCTKLVESGFLALLENANGTYSTTGFTFSAIGQAPHHNTSRQTAYTAGCASGSPTANVRGPGANPFSLVQPCPAHSHAHQLQLFNSFRRGAPLVQGPQLSVVVGEIRLLRSRGHFFRRLLHRSLPRAHRNDQVRPPAIGRHHSMERRLRIVVFPETLNRRHSRSVLTNPDGPRGALTALLSASPAPFSQLPSLDG